MAAFRARIVKPLTEKWVWLRQRARQGRFLAWRNLLRFSFAASRVRRRHSAALELLLWIAAVLLAWRIAPSFQRIVGPLMAGEEIKSLQTVVVTIGGAMIGATAILSSFVLFAMQVNVERLPYGLFHRFSSDRQLLLTFAMSFVIAITGTSLSLSGDPAHAAIVILLGIGAVAVVLRLLFHAYRRALDLVNPVRQLGMLYESVDRRMRRWDRRLRLVSGSIEQPENAEGLVGLDQVRAGLLRSSKGWDRELREAIGHAIAFARRAGETGDLEVSAAALSQVVALNQLYVRTKGRTFHSDVLLIHNPLVTDGTVNTSLEELRQLRDIALSRKDEPQAEQVFRTLLALTRAYAAIPYAEGSSLTHAGLAVGYLERSVEAALRHDLIDTTMNGIRTLGEAAGVFLGHGRPVEMTGIVKKIGFLGCAGIIKEGNRPLTLIAMEQLTELALALLRVDNAEVGFVQRQTLQSVSMIAKLFLNLPDTPFQSVHSTYLGPFYSSTSFTSLRPQLTALVNALVNAEPDNKVATTIADNLAEWADNLFVDQKELLLLSIEKESHFTFDMIHWIVAVCEILIAASRAPATREYTRGELEKHARWLFGTLTWIPRDPKTARFVETFQLVEQVFEFAIMSVRRDWEDGFDDAWKLLLNWGMEAGRDHTGWGTLENALTALAALALRPGDNRSEVLKSQLRAVDTPVTKQAIGTPARC